jgi:hypothetical protein
MKCANCGKEVHHDAVLSHMCSVPGIGITGGVLPSPAPEKGPLHPCHCGEIDRLTAELSRLRTAHDAAVEGRKMWQGVAEEAARQRDAALATGREQADALREMVELWERVHGTAIIGRPTVNAAKKALAAIPSPPNGCEWKKETPGEQALWWWWNEDGPPIPVSIMASGHENVRYFASQGQYGWNRAQWVEDMGGFWMKVVEPDPPISIKAEEGKP